MNLPKKFFGKQVAIFFSINFSLYITMIYKVLSFFSYFFLNWHISCFTLIKFYEKRGYFMKELEKMAQDFQEKRIDEKTAVNKLVEFIYRNKTWFGLNRLNEDDLHDFMLKMFPLFTGIFNRYDSSIGTFTCYLIGNIIQAYHGWKRGNARLQIKRRTLEEIECQRLMSNESGRFSDNTLFVSDLQLYQEHPVEEIKRMVSYHKESISRTEMTRKVKSIEKIRQEAALILMVKSWYLVDNHLLEKISAVTQVPSNSLIEILDKTKDLMERKTDKMNFTMLSRDRSYYYRERYRIERESPYGMNLSMTINRKRNFHSKKWHKFNRRLQDHNRRLVPSNRIVALVLGMDQRRVQYVLDRINKNMDILSLNWYYGRHEDLFGKRKLE